MEYLKKIKKQCVLFLISLIFSSLQTSAFAENNLVFNVTGQPPLNTSTHDGFMDEVAREALKRIGYKLIINRQPAERGLRSINTGVIDGEMSRIKGIDKIYPNLVMVNEKIMNWDFVVFSKKQINLDKGWTSLTDKNVSFINGWKILEKNVPKTARVTKTKNANQLFSLLKKDRTDYIIYERWGGHDEIELLQLLNVNMLEPALASKEMFIYLNKKHAALVPKISRALLSMKKDGSYKKLQEKFLKERKDHH